MVKLTDEQIAQLIAKNKKWCVERIIATRINAKGRRQFQVEYKNSTHKFNIWRRFREIALRKKWQWMTTAASTRGRVKVTWRPDWVDEDDLIKCRYLIRRFWVFQQQQQQQTQQNQQNQQIADNLKQIHTQHENPVMDLDIAEQNQASEPATAPGPEADFADEGVIPVQMEAHSQVNIAAAELVPEQLVPVPDQNNIVADDDDNEGPIEEGPIDFEPIAELEIVPAQEQPQILLHYKPWRPWIA